MGYVIAFIVIGAALIVIPISKDILIPILAIMSLGTAFSSFSYYSAATQMSNYVLISLSGPFLVLFWSIIKAISAKAPIFRINSIIGLYIIIYLPVIALTLNIFNCFTQDASISSLITYILLGVIVLALLILTIVFIVWEITKRRNEHK